MRKMIITTVAISTLFLFQGIASAQDMKIDSAATFKKNCKICHKLDKKGMGPAIKKMSNDPIVLNLALTNGRKSMPSFAKKLSADEIKAMVEHLLALQK